MAYTASENSIWLESTLSTLQHMLSKNTTLKERKQIVVKFNELTSKNFTEEEYFAIKDDKLFLIWEQFITFYNNIVTKNITDIIKQKSQFIANCPDFNYGTNRILLDKNIVAKLSDLLNYLSSLSIFFVSTARRLLKRSEIKNRGLLVWILENLIGDDFLISKDYQENFYDLTNGVADPFRFHFQIMLSEIILFMQPNRDAYDKILESQYLILTQIDESRRFSNCYQNAFKILQQVLPKNYIGKVHGTWEKILVSCFIKFLQHYRPKKEDEYLFKTGFYLLKISFMFNTRYKEFSRIVVDLFVTASLYIDCISMLEDYLLFLPREIDYERNTTNKLYWLEDIYRIIRQLFSIVLSKKHSIKYKFEILEYPVKNNWIKLGQYQYMIPDERFQVLAKYLMIYYKWEPLKKQGILTFEDRVGTSGLPEMKLSGASLKSKNDCIDCVASGIKASHSVIEFINKIAKDLKDCKNSEKILPPLAFLYFNFPLPVPDTELLIEIQMSSNFSFEDKLLFFLALMKNKPSLLFGTISELYLSLLLDSLGNIRDDKYADISSYFIYTCIFTSRGLHSDNLMAKVQQKVSNILDNISSLGPKNNNLATFKFWQGICCLRPIYNIDLCSTTFDHIIENWLPHVETNGCYLSLTNFVYWGFSENLGQLIKCKINLEDCRNALPSNIDLNIELNYACEFEFIKFTDLNQTWNNGCFRNLKTINNISNWLHLNMTKFSNTIGLLKMIIFIFDEVSESTLANIGFYEVVEYITKNLEEQNNNEKARFLMSIYDLFDDIKKLKNYPEVAVYLNMIMKPVEHMVRYDYECGRKQGKFIDFFSLPHDLINYTTKTHFLSLVAFHNYHEQKFYNYDHFNVVMDFHLKCIENLLDIERMDIVNMLVLQIKTDINEEKIHTVNCINLNCLLLGKVISSTILMQSQSKNKMLKLWLSIYCMSSPYTQPFALDSIKTIFKRIDIKSQFIIFNKLFNDVVLKQSIDGQYELLLKLAKISKYFFIKTLKKILKMCTESRLTDLSLLLRLLKKHYNLNNLPHLLCFAGVRFMAVLSAHYNDTVGAKVLISAIYQEKAIRINNNLLFLNDMYNKTNFIACLLACSSPINNFAALGITEFSLKEVVKANLLIKGNFHLPFATVEKLDVNLIQKAGPEATEALYLAEELDTLTVECLSNVINCLIEVATIIDQNLIEHVMFENEIIFIYDDGGISIEQLKIVDHFKKVDGSSLILKGNVLRLFFTIENNNLEYESTVLTLRKVKVLYLLIKNFSQNKTFVEDLSNCILKCLIEMSEFTRYFSTLRNFFFILISNVDIVEDYIKADILLKLVQCNLRLQTAEIASLESMVLKKSTVYQIDVTCLEFLGSTRSFESVTLTKTIIYNKGLPELILRHFTSSAKICNFLLLKGLSDFQIKNIWDFKFPKRYISLIDWNELGNEVTCYIVSSLENMTYNFKTIEESVPLENLIMNLHGRELSIITANEHFQLNLLFCYFKSLLKEPFNNNIHPSSSQAYESVPVSVTSGICRSDLIIILDMNSYDTAVNLNFNTDDSYLNTISLLWKKLVNHMPVTSIWHIMLLLDNHFENYNIIESCIFDCFLESVGANISVLKHFDTWFYSLLSTIDKSKIEVNLKKKLVLKMFLKLRDLHYSDRTTPGVDKLYSFFDLKILSAFALSIKSNELAFMLLEEDKTTWNDNKRWQSVLLTLDDSFLATSIPRSKNLIEYIKESNFYINDPRFKKSDLSFNSVSLDLNFCYQESSNSLSNSFWEFGSYKLANNLSLNEYNTDFSKHYDEIRSWDIPLPQGFNSPSSNINEIFYKFVKNKLIVGEENTEANNLKKILLLIDSFDSVKSEVLAKITDLKDKRLPVLNNQRFDQIMDMCLILEDPKKLYNSIGAAKQSNKFNIISNALDKISEINSKYGPKISQNILRSLIVGEEQKLASLKVSNKDSDFQFSSSIADHTDKTTITDKLCQLYFLDFQFNYRNNRSNNCIKALINLYNVLDDYKLPKKKEQENWNFILSFIDSNCRWLTGDIESSWSLLNDLLLNFDEAVVRLPLSYKTPIAIKKCLWSIESRKCSINEAWNEFYTIFKNSPDLSFSQHFRSDLDKISSYYHASINEKLQQKLSFKELDDLVRKAADLNKKQRFLAKKAHHESQNGSGDKLKLKLKLKQNIKILNENQKFISDRYYDFLNTVNEARNVTLNLSCGLLDLMSLEITRNDDLIYEEEIDRFFSIWFGLINYLSSDLFDGDDNVQCIVEQYQLNKSYYFKRIYQFETFSKKASRTKLQFDIDNNKKCYIVPWDDCLKKWKTSVDLIIAKHPASLLPWLSTFFSKLQTGRNSIFERLLENSLTDIILKCLELFPSITIHTGLSYENYSNDNNQKAKERAELISLLFNKEKIKNKQLNALVESYQKFSNFNRLLANSKAVNKVSRISLKSEKTCQAIFKKSSEDVLNIFNGKNQILLPIINFMDNKLYENDSILKQFYISGIDRDIEISNSGISRPRIFSFVLENGLCYKVLNKGHDDLRTDFIMLNAMKKINKLLFKATDYNIATYEVFSMGHNFGILEFKNGCKSLANILKPLHVKDKISFNQCRTLMDSAFKSKKSNKDKAKLFENIKSQVTPRFNEFFKINFPIVENWYTSKKNYVTSLAVTSIIGYVLGIGDRHLSNIMLNCDTGELIHIDFAITFDAGKKLSIPETVPFRFTNDIKDGLGIYYHYHTVDKYFEDVYKMVRDGNAKIMLSLENLKLDPLYKWSLNADEKYFNTDNNDNGSKVFDTRNSDSDDDSIIVEEAYSFKRQKISEDQSYSQKAIELVKKEISNNQSIAEQQSSKCLQVVLDKLKGSEERQSVESVVQMLLRDAQSSNNLSLIFCGWAPFY